MTHAELDALMHQRHSCRRFRPDPVPRPIIEQIITTAQKVPNWCNAQPWHLTVTSGAETERLRSLLQRAATSDTPCPDLDWPDRYSGVYRDRRRDCGWQLYESVGVEKGDRAAAARQTMENFALFGAPHCALISCPAELGPYAALDCGGFVATFTIAAQSLGVASIAQAAVASFAPLLHTEFEIPVERSILCGISFGYEEETHPANGFRTPRAALSEFTEWRGTT